MKNHSDDAYRAKVIKFLDKDGKFGATYTIDRICAKENQERFIEIVKQYMRETDWQGGWEFSADYKKLKRTNVFFNKPDNSRTCRQYQPVKK